MFMGMPKLHYVIAVILYGTTGYILNLISLPSEVVVLCRSALASLFLFLFFTLRGKKLDIELIKKNYMLFLPAGFVLGLNWTFMFASYAAGSVAIGSLLTYTAPIILVAFETLVHKKKMSIGKILCLVGVTIGIVFVSGVFDVAVEVNTPCVVYGLLSSAAFVFLIIFNRRLKEFPIYEKTFTSLVIATFTVLPYVFIMNVGKQFTINTISIVMILVLAILNTVIANMLYMGSIGHIPVETVAILGYVEPVVGTLLSVTLMNQPLGPFGIIGAVLIIASAIISEVIKK